MTVERLAAVVLLYAGMGVANATAEDVGEPIAVAVPVSQAAAASAEEPAGLTDPPTETESAEPLEEEYMPLDLPVHADETDTESAPTAGEASTATAPDADKPETAAPEVETSNMEMPGVEPAVLGLEDSPSTVSYLVHAEILGVPDDEGMVSASLCKQKNFTKSGCRTLRVPAREGQVSVTFTGVPPGAYAVQVHHDQNDNGKMDYTFFGLPKEPYGFSRDAKPMLAPPKFDSASFEVSDGNVSLIINLQNT